MPSKEEFMNAVGLQSNGTKEHRKCLTLPLKIDLARTQGSTSCPYLTSPSTSMLSPLSPKLRSPFVEITSPIESHRRLSVSKIQQSDPTIDSDAVLHLIDLTSPLGQRIIKTLKDLAHGPFGICHNYEDYCSMNPRAPTEPSRILRSYHADHSSNYLKRTIHRNLGRPYLFKKQEKRDRRKVLYTGLSTRSRKLLRSMKTCRVLLRRISYSSPTFPIEDEITAVSPNHIACDVTPCIVLERDCDSQQLEKSNSATAVLQNDTNEYQDTPLKDRRSEEHRKSVRLRRSPKHLIDSF